MVDVEVEMAKFGMTSGVLDVDDVVVVFVVVVVVLVVVVVVAVVVVVVVVVAVVVVVVGCWLLVVGCFDTYVLQMELLSALNTSRLNLNRSIAYKKKLTLQT